MQSTERRSAEVTEIDRGKCARERVGHFGMERKCCRKREMIDEKRMLKKQEVDDDFGEE